MGIIEEAKRVLRIEAEAIAALEGRVNSSVEQAVTAIKKCKGRLIISGMGKSGWVGNKISATMASTGTPSFFMHPAEASHGDLGMVTADDILLAISNSGETEEIIGLLPYLKRFSVKLISMTGNADSTLARASDIHIDVAVREEACPMGIVPTASTTAALAMGDALAVALLVDRGFRKEDFATFHPKGNLGKKLLIKVQDLMHSGDALPHVREYTPLSEAIIEISSKRLGITTVIDAEGRMLGVLTDGDLRRGIGNHGVKLFEMTSIEVMTRNPKTINPEDLAVKALAIMQEFSITSLVAVDESSRPSGIIHIHDILKEGIV